MVKPVPLSLSIVPADSLAAQHHADESTVNDSPRSMGRPAPCNLRVGHAAIDEAQIAQEMQHHRTATPEQSRAAAARALVVRALLRHEVERLGLDTVAFAAGVETLEEARIRALLQREVVDRVPSETDCLRYFEQNRERFRSPDRIRVSHILLGAAPHDVAARLDARQRGEKLIGELKGQHSLFADMAHRHSDCPSRTDGGDLGWLERGQTTPEFDRQIFRLHAGLAAFPVESRWGYHVVSIEAMEQGQALPFDAVRERISDYLELQLRQRQLQDYLLSLQERYGVEGLDEIEALAEQG
jgi:peptidyl-prolyl cis-trans isomerase C